jgi:hypothetical protein
LNKEENTTELNINSIKKGIVLTFLGAILFLFLHLTNTKNTDQDELQIVKGKIENYSFTTFSENGRSNLKNYQIKLENSDRNYKIEGNNIWLFKEETFEKFIQEGDLIELEIPNEIARRNNSRKFVPVLGIKDSEREYLISREVIRENKAPLFLASSGILFFSSITLLILIKYKSKFR